MCIFEEQAWQVPGHGMGFWGRLIKLEILKDCRWPLTRTWNLGKSTLKLHKSDQRANPHIAFQH